MPDNRQIKFLLNNADIVYEEYPDETVIADLKHGVYFTLNRPAADMFSALITAPSRQTAERWLSEIYKVDQHKISEVVDSLVASLVDGNIVALSPAGDPDENLPVPLALRAAAKSFGIPEMLKYSDVEDLLKLDPVHEVEHESGWPTISENQT